MPKSSNYDMGDNSDDYPYPSDAAHPLLYVDDPRATSNPGNDAHLTAFIDNGACFDLETGELGYRTPRNSGATGYGQGGADGGTA